MNQVELVEQIVKDYQNNINGSAQKLINEYDGFINKYLELICDGKMHFSNYSIKSFITSFKIVDNFKNVSYINKSKGMKESFCYAVEHIHNIFSVLDRDEVDNTLKMVLLDLASRYQVKDDKPRFSAYVNRAYHFYLYRALSSYIFDLAHINIIDGFIYNDDDFGINDKINDNILEIEYSEFLTDGDELDDDWIIGYNAHIFYALTPFERRLMKLAYVDKLADKDVAKKFLLCRATINRKRVAAERRIEPKLIKRNLLIK